MQEKYTPSEVEQAAQSHWKQIDAYKVLENDPRFPKGKYYACSMLPYPSGKLHMGHVRNYTINDMLARQLRMKGYNVLMPMGWDAFGLPAENAAIAYKKSPAEWTYANIEDMKSQMQPLGLAFDWSREIATCDPDYYRWNQWLFLKMLEKGIAFKKTQVVNWDPVDQTVLANEQVIDGRGWRSGALVEKREIPGYYFGITQYAEELLSSIDQLEGWPDQVRTMQRNWIGKSEGVRFAFPHQIKDESGALLQDGKMYVFTTRPDTIMGVTFCAVAAEHPIATLAAKDNAKLAEFIEVCKAGGTTEAEMATKEKEGMPTGLFVTHPISGEQIEVWVGNYVLMTYGDGAVMGVPAHDERDFAFANEYTLPIKPVVVPESTRDAAFSFGADGLPSDDDVSWFDFSQWTNDKAERGYCVNSGALNGLTFKAAVDAVAADLIAKELGEKKTTWRLRDWGISRQRYWGTPIPIIHCATCGDVPVPYEDLPVVLPTDCIPDGSGNPLKTRADFLNVPCPKCGAPAQRETDTMDTFVDSSWYYMRYTCPDASTMVDERNDYWMAMDQYIGGVEHAVMHLLYARFWTRAMRDLGLVKFSEPFKNLFTQGMLLNESYYREEDGGKKTWFYPNEIEVKHDEKGRPISAILKSDGQAVQMGGIEKMSKSKNNVVEPKDIIEQFGADTARLFTMFAGPPDQSAAWNSSGVEGASRYLRRLWASALKLSDVVAAGTTAPVVYAAGVKNLRREVHLTLKQIDADYDRLQYNTVVSGAMKLLNAIESFKPEGDGHAAALREAFGILLRGLYPVCPHITHALWRELGLAAQLGDIIDAPWPQVDEAALVQDEIELMIQVNGKLRGSVKVAKDADKASIEAAALATESVQKFLEGAPKKVIIVPGKLVNIVA